METSEKIDKIAPALKKFQAEVDNPQKNKEGHGYNYAPLPEVLDTVKPKLHENGLSVIQNTGSNDTINVQTILIHESGQFIKSDPLDLPFDKGKRRNDVQAAGSSITYARRYSLSSLLGIASEEDTDARDKQPKSNKSQKKKSKSKSNGKLQPDDIKKAIADKESSWNESAFADNPTEGQVGKFNAFWGQNIEGNENDRYRFLSKVTDRKIESSKDLMKGEISALIELTANKTMEFVELANKIAVEGTEEMFE